MRDCPTIAAIGKESKKVPPNSPDGGKKKEKFFLLPPSYGKFR